MKKTEEKNGTMVLLNYSSFIRRLGHPVKFLIITGDFITLVLREITIKCVQKQPLSITVIIPKIHEKTCCFLMTCQTKE